jgi:hypothetical protein
LCAPRALPLKSTEQPVDTSTAAGKCFLDILGVLKAQGIRPTDIAKATGIGQSGVYRAL